MTPIEHSYLMVRDFGGKAEDYIELNELIDSSKLHYPIWLHRAVTHNSWFIGIVEKIIGRDITNSDGVTIPTRVLCICHIRQDCDGRVPTIKEWLEAIVDKKQELWMNGPVKRDLDWLKENYKKANE